MEEEHNKLTSQPGQDIPVYKHRCCIASGRETTEDHPPENKMLNITQAPQANSPMEPEEQTAAEELPQSQDSLNGRLRHSWKRVLRFCRGKLRWILAMDLKSAVPIKSFPIKNKTVIKQYLKELFYHNGRTAMASVFVSLILVAFSLILAEFFSAGYDAYINGTYVATISEKSQIQSHIQQLNDRIVQTTGESGDIPAKVDYVFKFVPKESLSADSEINRSLLSFSSRLKDAYVITVDETPVTTVASLSDASASLDTVKNQYKNGQNDVSVEILNDIKVESEIVPTTQIASISTAAQSLNSQKAVDVDYIVQPEDSLWSLAKENSLSVDEIKALNPGLDETLANGNVIRLKQKEPILDVKTVQSTSYQETVPPPVNQIEDATLYQGTTQVVEPGYEGVKTVNAKVIKINGQEVERMVLSEAVVSAPTPSSVIVGTRPIPTGIGSGQFDRPYAGVITSRFGSRWGSVHKGIDIGGSIGDAVLSSDEGKVVFAGWNNGGYGNLVILDHGNGYQTYYAHMSEVLVKEGDVIEKGYQLGKVGNTGRSTGPHLHFEVRKDGEPQDPQSYCY